MWQRSNAIDPGIFSRVQTDLFHREIFSHQKWSIILNTLFDWCLLSLGLNWNRCIHFSLSLSYTSVIIPHKSLFSLLIRQRPRLVHRWESGVSNSSLVASPSSICWSSISKERKRDNNCWKIISITVREKKKYSLFLSSSEWIKKISCGICLWCLFVLWDLPANDDLSCILNIFWSTTRFLTICYSSKNNGHWSRFLFIICY